jgi:hypothetical protein
MIEVVDSKDDNFYACLMPMRSVDEHSPRYYPQWIAGLIQKEEIHAQAQPQSV